MTYTEFLKSKIVKAPDFGIVEEVNVNPALFPHQADICRWAIRGGRRAIFAAFGLGKTVMQVQICESLAKQAHEYSLIVAPLGVRQEFVRDAKNIFGIEMRYIRNDEDFEQEKREQEMKARFEIEFPARLMKAKETITDWREVPAYFYDSIKKRWGIQFEPGEAQQIFEDAKQLAEIEINKGKDESIEGGLKARFEAMDREKAFEEIAKTIARKITVFRKIVKNPDFQVA